MLRLLAHRFAAALVTLFIVSTLIFAIIHLLPGDPVLILLGEQAVSSPEVVAKVRHQLRLDQPLHVQYLKWIQGLARLDFGASLQNAVPVAQELRTRIPRSLELIAASLVIAAAIGLPLGALGARAPASPLGWLSALIAVVGLSTPVFVTGVVLIVVFSLKLGLFPSSGYVRPAEDFAGHLLYAILPAVTLGFGFVGVVIRMTRASLLDVLGKAYVRTARAKGLRERRVVYQHALANALVPVITVLGVRAANLLGGMVIVESLFNWPGLSSLLVRSVYDRDYPMIQGALFSIFSVFILIGLLIDLLHGLVDPRVRPE
jgi:peptide/nickel transport system permease protein